MGRSNLSFSADSARQPSYQFTKGKLQSEECLFSLGQVLPEKHSITQTALVPFTAQRAGSNTAEWPLMGTNQASFPSLPKDGFYAKGDKELIGGTCNPLP